MNYAHLLPPVYAKYFVLNAEVHDYNTRASTDLHVLGPRSTFGQRCIRYKGSVISKPLLMYLYFYGSF